MELLFRDVPNILQTVAVILENSNAQMEALCACVCGRHCITQMISLDEFALTI